MAQPEGDLNADCVVDYRDLELLAENWLSDTAMPGADIDGDGRVNVVDFGRLANAWLEQLLWP